MFALIVGALLAPGYMDDPSLAPYWERVGGDANCTHESDCGFPGITPEACRAKGCCFDTSRPQFWCSGVATPCTDRASCSGRGECVGGACQCDAGATGHNCSDVVITKVHLVASCHLDVGFTDLSAGVINTYLSHHIPTAIATAAALRADSSLPPTWRLSFMAQSYYVGFYLDCPEGMGFACPTPAQQDALRAAIARGDITWHAFPHNAELENTSPAMLAEGLRATHALDAAFGLPPKRSLSQRDVPGVPRSAIPLLAAQNVSLVSVGVNGASMYPRVPKMFNWRDPVSGEAVLAMWHPRGYGGFSAGEAVTAPGFGEALVTDWIGDNAGPGDAAHYVAVFQKVQKEFPNATVVGSSFDAWLDAVDGAAAGAVRAALPTVELEVGDSWIYGVPSDPKKTAQARALDRAITAFRAAGGARDAAFLNFTRLATKNCEHTWGRDVKTNLKDNAHWRNAEFAAARLAASPTGKQFDLLEESWWEQRAWGFDFALQALPPAHPLRALALKEIADLNQPVPFGGTFDDAAAIAAAGFAPLADPAAPTACGDVSIAFDAATGAINHLADSSGKGAPFSWASAGRLLLDFTYRTYSAADLTTFQAQYSNLTKPPDWFARDFGKPNETFSTHSVWHGALRGAWRSANASATTFLLLSAIADPVAQLEYGAPAALVTRLVVAHAAAAGAPRVAATVWSVNKTATRMPETMFVSFAPDNATATGEWEMQKLGQWQKTVGDVVAGGSQHLHGVSIGSGVRYNSSAGRSIAIEAVDAPVVNLGEPLGLPVPCEKVDKPWAAVPDVDTFGVSSVLWNNLWGTNYVQWYPFNRHFEPVAGEENFISRYNFYF